MPRRTILLSVDGSLLVEIDSPDRDYAAFREGREYHPLVVPEDAQKLEMSGRGGRGPYFYRSAVVEGLRDVALTGVDIVWNTRWLASPALLAELSRRLGLDEAVRSPTAAELPVAPVDERIDFEPNALWEHWKIQALIHRVRDLPAGDELVLIDAVLDHSSRRLSEGVARRARRDDVLVAGINTNALRGLDERSIQALRTWIDGGPIPRI